MRKSFVPILVVALALLALPASAALVGTASGVVKDTTGAPLPGVSVTIAGPSLQGTRTTVTRSDGSFTFHTLPPGKDYRITFALDGFVTVQSEVFAVKMDLDTQVHGVMQLATVKSEIVVSAEAPVVDVTQTTQQQNFTADYLKKIPIGSGNRSYQSIPNQSAGVVGTSNPSVYGGNSMENSYLVDGVNTTDPVTHTFSFNLNFDAVQEVALQKSGYDAEYGHASGGILNVVTKSGGNEFSGTFDIRYDNNKWVQNGENWTPVYHDGTTGSSRTKYDNSLSKSRNTPWGVTLGGPIVKDQLWFFVNSARADTFSTPYIGDPIIASQIPDPAVRRFTGYNSGGKLSFTAIPELSGFLAVNDSFADILGLGGSSQRPEATYKQEQKSRLYSLKLNGVLSSSWIADLSVGRSESYLSAGPSTGDDSISNWYNAVGGNVGYDNYSNHQAGHRNRNLAGIQTTYFIQNFLGNHQVKGGFDGDMTEFPNYNWVTGTPSDDAFCPHTDGRSCGAYFKFNGFDPSTGARRPANQYVVENLPMTNTRSRSYDGYLQDQWKPFSRLTVNFGVRWDEVRYYDNHGLNFMNMVKFQPRVAAAMDLFGDGKTAVRANYGQFYVDAALTFNRLFNSNYTTPVSRTYAWLASKQQWRLSTQTGGTAVSAALIDGSLHPTYDEQVSFAIEREVTPGLKAAGSYVYKKTKDMFEDTCIDYTECPDYWVSAYPGRGLPGVTENPLRKDYFGYTLELQYNKGRLLASANYTYSKSRGSIDSSEGQYAGADFDVYPDHFVNRYGYLGDDARHRVKVFGNYRIPYIETDLGFGYTYRTGLAYSIARAPVKDDHPECPNCQLYDYILLEPRGSSRTSIMQQLDLELKKSIPVVDRVTVTPIFSVLNVLNAQTATANYSITDSKNWGSPASWQTPRRFQVGFRIDWQ